MNDCFALRLVALRLGMVRYLLSGSFMSSLEMRLPFLQSHTSHVRSNHLHISQQRQHIVTQSVTAPKCCFGGDLNPKPPTLQSSAQPTKLNRRQQSTVNHNVSDIVNTFFTPVVLTIIILNSVLLLLCALSLLCYCNKQ